MPADDIERVAHHLLHVGRRALVGSLEQFHGERALPDGAMDRAIDRLVLRFEELLNLVVRTVDGAGAAGFVFTFATQFECRFGERAFRSWISRRVGWRR
jgi:hypothetical protein